MKNTHSSSCNFEGCVHFDFLDYFLDSLKGSPMHITRACAYSDHFLDSLMKQNESRF
jgi:hypothetical protein